LRAKHADDSSGMTFSVVVAMAALVAAGSGVLLWRLAPAAATSRRRHGAVGFDEELRPRAALKQPVDDDGVSWDDWDGPMAPWQRGMRIAGLVVVTVAAAAVVAVLLYTIGHFVFQALLNYVPNANE
jgi:hypothetical protein